MARRKSEKPVKPPSYSVASKLRFTPQQAAQEDKWAMELYESRKRFVDHVRLALQTRSPTRRRELYEQWRKLYGDDTTRTYARYAESIYAGGDTKLLDRFMEMIKEPPKPIPEFMILRNQDDTGKQV